VLRRQRQRGWPNDHGAAGLSADIGAGSAGLTTEARGLEGLPHASERTGRRLGTVVLLYLTTAVAVITLAPFQFEPRPVNGLTAHWALFDVVMNVVMFVPIGFVWALSHARERAGTGLGGALVLGFALSGAVELAQVFTPSRFPSLFDLVANTSGAGIGAWLAGAAIGAARQRGDASATVRALAVDLPLMGLTYLTAPLVWLVALGADDPQRTWAVAPLAAGAAWAIGSVFTSFEGAQRTRVLTVTLAWLGVALLPSAVPRAGPTVAIALIAVVVAWARTVAPARFTHDTFDGKPSRRFEAATLRVILPLFGIYLALSVITPFASPTGTWSGALGLAFPGRNLQNAGLYRALEQIAAFALLGYALAEYRGRVHDHLHRLLPAVLVWTAPASAALQWLRGWHPAHGSSGVLLALTVAASAGGAWLYVLQLEHVRALAPRRSVAG
jgi:VanZ family protein